MTGQRHQVPEASAPPPTDRRPYDLVKRWMDVVLSALLLVLAMPLMLVIGGLILATLGHPVLFRQARAGQDGRLFDMVKFRTMREVDRRSGLVTDADRLTPMGRWLRASSLDELPELWNVLRGEMSLVGPRPQLAAYLDRYSPQQARRHEVRPGLTGLAQVCGRNALSWERKFEYDVEYVDRRSLLLDLRILVRTVRVVLCREGISAPGTVTAHEFTGSLSRAEPGLVASPERIQLTFTTTRRQRSAAVRAGFGAGSTPRPDRPGR